MELAVESPGTMADCLPDIRHANIIFLSPSLKDVLILSPEYHL
jgi:hypothetical protein